MQEGKQTPHKFDLKEVEPWMVRTTGSQNSPQGQTVVGRLEMPKRRASPSVSLRRARPTSLGRSLGGTQTHPSVCKGDRASYAAADDLSDITRRSAEKYTAQCSCACHGSELQPQGN